MAKLSITQQVGARAEYVDALGNPTIVDGAPTWSVSEGGVVELVATADPNRVEVKAKAIGFATITISADADTSSGIRLVSNTATVEVVAGDAVAANIVFDTVTEQPVVEPTPEPAPEPAPVEVPVEDVVVTDPTEVPTA